MFMVNGAFDACTEYFWVIDLVFLLYSGKVMKLSQVNLFMLTLITKDSHWPSEAHNWQILTKSPDLISTGGQGKTEKETLN